MQLPKSYNPDAHETQMYQLWEQSGAFSPKESKGEPFSMVMPPPNANGNLHLGHALTIAIEDTLVRWRRMQGRPTLYLPGSDHAGFETQVVYERRLEQEGKSRFDFTAGELRRQIYDFVMGNKSNMEAQVRSLGASCDWSRNTFTLDQVIIERTYATFQKLWDDGLIYRGQRIVNYCTHHQTSFSDLEIEYEDRTTPLYYMQYGPFEIATTRPETKFGDTAIAVHPEDSRYQQYVGKEVEAEGVNGPFTIRVIADEAVDPEFGTGVIKVTPAHDFTDFEIGERHGLEVREVITKDGTLNDRAGRFAGMTVAEAREAVAEALKEKDLLLKVDKHYQNRVAVCYKCSTVIEPLVLDQWLIKVEPLARAAIQALDADKITVYPKSKKAVFRQWYENLRDWNISRQIAWGMPIPAFHNADDPHEWVFDTRTDQETITVDGKLYHRDPDVFDTWFSSGQWPFNTLGYPDSQNFKRFYPNSLMETAADILFFWVSRMIMLGLYVTGEVPFEEVYLHGLVLDEHGQKMSKSKGNVIAPQDVQAEYGSDALRTGLLSGRAPDQNQAFDPSKVVAGRNFANKLWNVARFILADLPEDYRPHAPEANGLVDEWLLSRLNQAIHSITADLERYRLSQAWEQVYSLLWDDFADWYVEASKIDKNQNLLVHGLENILKLAHPFTPFVSEAIWQQLPWQTSNLINADWPAASKVDVRALANFGELQNISTEIRNLNHELDLDQPTLYHFGGELLEANTALITKLADLSGCEAVSDGRGLPIPNVPIQAWLDVNEDTVQHYQQSLQQNLEATNAYIQSLGDKLGNKGFTHNAPKEVVRDTEQRLEDSQARARTLSQQLERLDTNHQ